MFPTAVWKPNRVAATHSMATIGKPEIKGREEFKRHEQDIRALYPDRQVTYEMVVAEGDKVAAYATFTGTHAELGKSIELKYLVMMRIADGKIAEIWVEWDNLTAQKQLGIWPPPVYEAHYRDMKSVTGHTTGRRRVRMSVVPGTGGDHPAIFHFLTCLFQGPRREEFSGAVVEYGGG